MASEFDILSSARSSKWKSNAPGNLPSASPKLSTQSADTDKMDMYKENHSEKNGGANQNKSHNRRENLMTSNVPTAPEISPSAVNAMLNSFKYGGLNMPPNFADAASLTNAAYMNTFGFPGPFAQLPMQMSSGNIAVAGVMPNALQTLAARLSSVGAGHMPHVACTSPTDLNSIPSFPTTLSPPFLGDFEPQITSLDYFARLYATMSMINPLRPQNPLRSSRPTPSRQPYVAAPRSDKSRKDLPFETTARQEGVTTNEKGSYEQNGAGNATNNMMQSSNKPVPHIKPKHRTGEQSNMRTFKPNKLKAAASKEQKPQSNKTPDSNSGKSQSITERQAAETTKDKNQRTPRDLGTEEAAAILLRLSNATEDDRVADDKQNSYSALADKNRPIDYSSRSTAHKDDDGMVGSRWSNIGSIKHHPNTNSQDLSKNALKKVCLEDGKKQLKCINTENNSVDIILSDGEYVYDLGPEETKSHPGGFNFKKVIYKKFTEERDPKDRVKSKRENNIAKIAVNLKGDNEKIQATSEITKTQKTVPHQLSSRTDQSRFQSHDKSSHRIAKSSHHLKSKMIPNKKSGKQLKNENNKQKATEKPHCNAQSFSDLRAISKQLHPVASKVTSRSSAKGLYRDAFGGSSDSMESLGESENEDKEDESESESEDDSSSEESDKVSECISDSDDEKPQINAWGDKTLLKRPFSLSRPKFTLSNSVFQSGQKNKTTHEEEIKQQEQSRITIRSPTFKFSKSAILAKNKVNNEIFNPNKNESSNNSKHKIGLMPRVSANTLPKPRIAARISKHLDINKKRIHNMPELKFEETSKSTIKSLFMQALNKSGECGGKPVGIHVDHKALKVIGLANTDYFVHNNKKYILRRAIARKKLINKVKGNDVGVVDNATKKTKFVIQELQRRSNNRRHKNHAEDYANNSGSRTSDNSVDKPDRFSKEHTGHSAINAVQGDSKNLEKIATKRRKRSLDVSPTVQCTDDSDIFSKVKLRHRNTLHNVNSTETSTSTNTVTTHANTSHRSRKKQWQRHLKRKLKKTGDLYMLSQLSYNKSIARAKKICQRRNVNIRKHIPSLSEDKNPAHCVRIMASASRPSYQILRQIRETKEKSVNDLNVQNNDHISPKSGGKTGIIEHTAALKSIHSDATITCNLSQKILKPDTVEKNNAATHSEKNTKNDHNETIEIKTNSIRNCNVPVIAGAMRLERIDKNPPSDNTDSPKINKLKRKANFQHLGYSSKAPDSFKLSSFFKSPPSLCVGVLFGDLQTSYTLSKPGQDNTLYKQSLKDWRYGLNAIETKQQQQRDGWKKMTIQTYSACD